jgi:hypothetical protein
METVVPGHTDRALASPLDPHEQTKLAGILSRLSSPYENERAIAGLLASVFVAKHDLMWYDLTTLLLPIHHAAVALDGPRQQPDRRRGGNRQWRGYCRRRRASAGQSLNLLT